MALLALPRGVADSAASKGFVMRAGGVIDALDLRTGNLEWSAAVQARPIAVAGKLLAALSLDRPYRLLLLDVSHRGDVVRESDSLRIPRWVSTEASSSEAFSYEVEVVNASELLLRWEAHAAVGGAARTLAAPSERAVLSGLVHVQLPTGGVSTAALDRPLALPVLALSRRARASLGATGDQEPSRLISARWFVGERSYRIEQRVTGKERLLSLAEITPDSAEPHRVSLLATGTEIGVKVTPDGRYLLIASQPRRDTRAAMERWDLISVDQGKHMGWLNASTAVIEPCVIQRVLYYVEASARAEEVPLVLHAFDVTTSRALWQHALGTLPKRTRAALPP